MREAWAETWKTPEVGHEPVRAFVKIGYILFAALQHFGRHERRSVDFASILLSALSSRYLSCSQSSLKSLKWGGVNVIEGRRLMFP